MALLGALSAVAVAGQQANSQADAVTTPARIYDEGPDVVAPELLPRELAIPEGVVCKSESDDEIALSLIVDTNGKPRDVKVINPRATPLERLATRIVEDDRFTPGTVKDEAVEVRRLVTVSLEGCIATGKDSNGNSTDVFRLTAQPKQTFGVKRRQEYIPPEPEESTELDEPPAPAAPDFPGLERVGNGVSAPVPLNNIAAKYSEEARSKKINGVCLISVIVDAEGRPQNPRVARTLGYGLDEKALEAIRKYHFKPAMKGKAPVPVMITVEVNFRLY
jgi:TonB family protein